MSGMGLIWFILIGLAAGWLTGQIMKGGGFGVVGDIVVGVLGALGVFLDDFLVGQGGIGEIAELEIAFAGPE